MSSFEKDDQPGQRIGVVTGSAFSRRNGLKGVLGIAALATLAACGGNDEDQGGSGGGGGTGGTGGDVVVNGGEPQNKLIPTNTNEVNGGRLLDSLWAGLVYYKADGTPENDIAESISSTDAQTYTIKIKSGTKFSDGTPVAAKNFVDAWNYGALGTNTQLSSYFFQPIEGFDAVQSDPPTAQTLSGLAVVDDTTFTVKLVQPQSDFPLRLGYSAFYPLPDNAYDDIEAYGENPVGNGPYKLKAEGAWQHNVRIDFVPNENYDGPRKAQNDSLAFVFYETYDAAYAALQSGDLDVLDNIPPSALATFQDELGDRAVNQPSAVFQSFTIPQKLAHFEGEEGKLRRQAISYAIDRAAICKSVFSDTRTPAKDFTSPVIAGYSETVPGNEVLTADAAKAKQLWQQADAISPYTDTFTIGYNADGGHQEWVDAVTALLRQTLGIKAEGAPYPTFAALRTDVTDRTIKGAFRSGWQADYPGLFNFIGPLYATGADSNDGDYSNPEVDAKLSQAESTTDQDAANKILQEVQTILFADLPAIPLWYSNASGGYAESASNVEFGWNSVPLYYQVTKS
ncbi:oligopeptide transport system substrate-binding protein [Kineococcus aurantiacus]|uniref:Oligopeptide transport system substrate-binding protein n=1 Tax=Kineococcus aurantiacus TaxID=37633 RepID=A0A7Y9J2C0_9ACTN|nr:ABC transporter substrate-binding protein [Kineococcus aurantiacus]NYD23979.1 oligopeptide transport system substrate-binding protein [Kineococcus aurantiacus]